MVRTSLILVAASLVIACADTAPQPDTNVKVRSEQQDKLFELSALNRNIAMKRAITGAGYPCKRVEYSGYVGVFENLDQWTAKCDDGRQWAVFTGADDTAQIRYCKDVEKAGLPACEITRLDTRDETDVKDVADG